MADLESENITALEFAFLKCQVNKGFLMGIKQMCNLEIFATYGGK